jgi:predicted small lipoprotein YifL
MILRTMVSLMLVFFALAACGKRGNPEPPGPASKVTYPRAYPRY